MATVQFEQKSSSRRIAIIALFAVSILIILLGLAFGVYSYMNNVSYTVLNADIPGFVFAAIVVFLGVRYFISVLKMNKRLKNTKDHFNWNNFKISHTKTKKMEG